MGLEGRKSRLGQVWNLVQTLSAERGELGMSGLPHVWAWPNVTQAWPRCGVRAGHVFAPPKRWKFGVWAWLEILRMLRCDLACSRKNEERKLTEQGTKFGSNSA
ncbi:hypothetical protein PIB30_087236 [Stylosanthes scabra]|uniref:Uncharacterized protein n=1 Tax=Stylosanthes scabra TaxID=79078 RepID=A0ABU6ZS72_9FABA|nr:hypothetical protein [Stylosanthes scabra]